VLAPLVSAALTYNDETSTGNMPAIHGLFFNKLYLGGLKLDELQGDKRARWAGSRQGFQGEEKRLSVEHLATASSNQIHPINPLPCPHQLTQRPRIQLTCTTAIFVVL